MTNKIYSHFSLALILFMQDAEAFAYDINEQFSIGGVLAVNSQCQDLSDASSSGNGCEWAVPFQPELSFSPTEVDELFFKLGFAAGNGLNANTPFLVSPWAADMEDDVKNINGRGRNHLLTALYKHTFDLGDRHGLGISFGIIDSTDYLDNNAYANDEYTQFMNSVLINGPNVFLPSYDWGLALEWVYGSWSLNGVLMNIGENEDGNNTDFYGFHVGYHTDTRLGAGNYRAVIAGSGADFISSDGTRQVKRSTLLLSFDQAFGSIFGGWVRFGWRFDDSVANYDTIYSGGIDLKGAAWGRGADNIGIGHALLNGGNQNVDQTDVAEIYYRWQASGLLALTADIQYMNDDYKTGIRHSGWIYGLRATAEF